MTAPTVADPNLDWRLYALCGDDIDLWFPEGHPASKDVISQYTQARAICQRCPVRDDCLRLTLAMESGDAQHRNGMAAGYTPHQRADADLMRRALEALERGDDPPGQVPMPPGHQPCGGCGKPVAATANRQPGMVWWCGAPQCARIRRNARPAEPRPGMPTSKRCAAGCGTDVPYVAGRSPDIGWWCKAEPCQRARRQSHARRRNEARVVARAGRRASRPCACGCGRIVEPSRGRKDGEPWWAPECKAIRDGRFAAAAVEVAA